MGVFNKIKQPASKNTSGYDKSASAPSIKSEMERFISTVAANDLARSNLFLVRMEKHQSYSPIVPSATSGESLNGLSEVKQLVSAGGFLANEDPVKLLKALNKASSKNTIKTGFSDYNTEKMGVSNGNVDTAIFDPSRTISMYAEAVTLPSITAEVRKEHMQYQRKNLLMSSKDHSGLSITFRCSDSYSEYNYLRWIVDQKIDNKTNVVDFPDNFILPQICVYIYNREANAVATAIHNKCLITSISSLEYSYESNNEVAKFTVEFMPEDIKFKTYSPVISLFK